MNNNQKLTSQLSKHLESSEDTELLDVIVELNPQSNEVLTKAVSRQEKIVALQKDFAKQSAPIESAISDAGGEITGRAWINKTIKARVPANSLQKISEHEEILTVDVPHQLEEDE